MLTSSHCLVFIDTSADLHRSSSCHPHILCVFRETPWQKTDTLPRRHIFPRHYHIHLFEWKKWKHDSESIAQKCCAIGSNGHMHVHTHTHTHGLTHTHAHWGTEITDGEFSEVGGPGFLGYASDSHYIVLLLRKSLGGHRHERGSRPDASVLSVQESLRPWRESSPGMGPVVFPLGWALDVDGLCCHISLQGFSLKASLTCFRGEDQLFHAPTAMMHSQPIKILFHSQQGSWQPWVSPAGWTGCN